MKLQYPLILVMLAIMLSCTGSTTTETSNSEPDNILEGMKLKTMEGEAIDLTQYKGKTVFINFWATWCQPCIAEMPSIVSASEKLTDDDVEFLLVSNEPRAQIKKFISSHDFKLNFVQLNMPLEQMDIKGLPTTFIVTPNGKLAFSEPGAREWDNEENVTMIKTIKDNETFPL